MLKSINQFLENEEGATATEYSIMIVLIILVAMVTINLLGLQVDAAFDKFIDLYNKYAP